MKTVSVVLVLMLLGTVCSSCAIDCMDVWDEESIAEMIEDDRRYDESLKAGLHEDVEDNEHPVDNEDEILPGTHDEDEDGDDHAHDGNHDEPNVKHAEQDQRHKRESPTAEQSIAEEVVNEEPSDLETAETHLFRPVFRYKSQYTERRRVRTSNGGVNYAPTQ